MRIARKVIVKMKKINQRGFVLAETLVVTVFLMVLFAMIYTNFFPLIGEYEKRETYDDIDGKYAAYWIKKMIESTSYDLSTYSNWYNANSFPTPFRTKEKGKIINDQGFIRFQCSDLKDGDSQTMCKDLVTTLQVSGCDSLGDYCDIYITKYQVGGSTGSSWFKNIVKGGNMKRYQENCSGTDCKNKYVAACQNDKTKNFLAESVNCSQLAEKDIFSDGFKDYMLSLPDYLVPSANGAKYRVFVTFYHKKDFNNYYSYATFEVSRSD